MQEPTSRAEWDVQGRTGEIPESNQEGFPAATVTASQVRYQIYLDTFGHRIRGLQLDVHGPPAVRATAAAVGEAAMHATPAEVRRTLRHNGGPWALPGARTEAAGLDQCLQAMRLALRSVDPPAHGHRGCRAVTLPGHPEESRIDEPRVARQERTAASSLARPGPFDTGLEKR